MRIEVATDVAFHPIRKLGAFAMWIKSDRVRIRKSGPINQVDSAIDAEWILMVDLFSVLLEVSFEDVTMIVIICGEGVHEILNGGICREPGQFHCRAAFRNLKEKYTFVTWEFRTRGREAPEDIPGQWCGRTVEKILIALINHKK